MTKKEAIEVKTTIPNQDRATVFVSTCSLMQPMMEGFRIRTGGNWTIRSKIASTRRDDNCYDDDADDDDNDNDDDDPLEVNRYPLPEPTSTLPKKCSC